MRPAPVTMPVPYLRQVAEQVQAFGAEVASWLAPSGLTPAQLETLEALPFESFRQLILDALSITREPAFGLFLGQRLQVQTHGVLGYAALSSGSIRQALGLFTSFTRTRFSLIELSLHERPGQAQVRFQEAQPLGSIQRPLLEAVIMATKNLLDSISMGAAEITTVWFPFEAPLYAGLARQMLGCQVRYRSSWAGFALSAAALDLPLRAADPVAFREAVRICERELERLAANATFAGRVQRLLLEQRHGFPSLEVAARSLSMTPRTLHRRLVAEGTSFRQVLDEVRHRLALEHLKSAKLGLGELAYSLGYTDFANFRRAFKRWEGVAPSEYRRRSAR